MDGSKGSNGYDVSGPAVFSVEIPEDQTPEQALFHRGNQHHRADGHQEVIAAHHIGDGLVIVVGKAWDQLANSPVGCKTAGIIGRKAQNHCLAQNGRMLGGLLQSPAQKIVEDQQYGNEIYQIEGKIQFCGVQRMGKLGVDPGENLRKKQKFKDHVGKTADGLLVC